MKKGIGVLLVIFSVMIAGCSNEINKDISDTLSDDGVFYEIFVRSFADSNGDGIGDLNGVTDNLDYLVDLGIKGIWLMPINPSPSYHGYDVTDYYNINPQYGTLEDFENLIKEANDRGIKIVMDLVLNHASSEHPWFVESKKDQKSPYSDYFIWADANDTTYDFNASPIEGKAWFKSGERRYFGAFWDGMPDWNASNPEVREEFINIGKFWLDLGVDGFRLDAAKYMYAQGEYNQDLNLVQENLDFWEEVTSAWRKVNDDVYVVAEVWSGNTSVAPYYQNFDANFNFDLADNIISVVRRKSDLSGYGLMKNYMKMVEGFEKYADDKDIHDAIFLSNHDQDRVMSVLKNDMESMKLAAEIYLMLAGNPYIYYGEEIGMLGRKPDEDIRFPFKWGNDSQPTWRTDTYNTDLADVQMQLADDTSLLNHYKSLIKVRNESEALTSGDMVPVAFDKGFAVGHIRSTDKEAVLVIHNVKDKDISVEIAIKEDQIIHQTKTPINVTETNIIVPSRSSIMISVPVEQLEMYSQINLNIG
ncbi:MAG: alpha-amylase family glycosyl hydrolase [Turicibacter sp.]